MQGQRLLFPACPGEPPSPRGALWKPHEGGGACSRRVQPEESVCIRPSGLHLHLGLCCLVFPFCVGCPSRLARDPLVLQPRHGHLAEGRKRVGRAPPPTPPTDGEFLVSVPTLLLFPSHTWPRTLEALVSVWASLRDRISSCQTFPLLQPHCGDTVEGAARVGVPWRAGGAQQDLSAWDGTESGALGLSTARGDLASPNPADFCFGLHLCMPLLHTIQA